MFYLELFKTLDEHRVRYALVGGVAMNLHGVPRMTMDVDLVLGMDVDNLTAFVAAAHRLGLRPAAPVRLEDLLDPEKRREWTDEKRALAFSLHPPRPGDPVVDVLLAAPVDMAEVVAGAEVRDVGGVPVRLAAVEHMVRLKESTGRIQDLADVEHLRRLRRRARTDERE